MKIISYETLMDKDKQPYVAKGVTHKYKTHDKLDAPSKIADMFRDVFQLDVRTEEYVYMLALDAGAHPVGVCEISHGHVIGSFAGPREIYMRALLLGASTIVLIHNHPTGVSNPSNLDIDAGRQLKKVGEMIGVPLLDSIIVCVDEYCSLQELKYLEEE